MRGGGAFVSLIHLCLLTYGATIRALDQLAYYLTPERVSQALRLLVHNPQEFFQRLVWAFGPLVKDPEYRRRWSCSLTSYFVQQHRDVFFQQGSWMGVRSLKNPLDAWIYQEILCEVRPDIVLEIGSYEGGTTLYLAHLLELIGNGQVISLDIDRTRFTATHDRIIVITGDSGAPETVAQVAAFCDGRSVLVIHDGDHHKEAVLRDLRAYAPLVTLGSYLIVEDGVIDLFKTGDIVQGPLAAVTEFLHENSEFMVDASRERYVLTYCPHGFLKRICEPVARTGAASKRPGP